MSKVVSISPSRDIAIKQAESLRKHLKKTGVDIAKTASLEAVAAVFNFKNWDTYSAFLVKQDKPSPDSADDLDREHLDVVQKTGPTSLGRTVTIMAREASEALYSAIKESAKAGDVIKGEGVPAIHVSGSDYTPIVSHGKRLPLPDLGAIINTQIEGPVNFALKYPFDAPLIMTARESAGLTYCELIDIIRVGYRIMYGDKSVERVKGLLGVKVEGAHSDYVHEIWDLVVEGIAYDSKTKTFILAIGS